MTIIMFLIFGFVAGLIARMLLPASHPMSVFGTGLLGVVGSLVGAFLTSVFFGYPIVVFHPTCLIGSILGSMVVLFIVGFAYYPKPPRFLTR